MGEILYTDEELCWATQVAYCNVDDFNVEEYYEKNTDYPTLLYIFSQYKEEIKYEIYYNQKLIKDSQEGDKIKMQQAAKDFVDAVREGEICKDWKIGNDKKCEGEE